MVVASRYLVKVLRIILQYLIKAYAEALYVKSYLMGKDSWLFLQIASS